MVQTLFIGYTLGGTFNEVVSLKFWASMVIYFRGPRVHNGLRLGFKQLENPNRVYLNSLSQS